MLRISDQHHDDPRPVSAQQGDCGVTVMPRDRVVLTAVDVGFLVLSERQAWDLETALRAVRERLGAR